ncbi:MAG: glycosyltransferase family 9 protein [Bacteroidales bacterium]|nr:glycosyltransferase family 9 protein [Bacteroidales bacterium]
MASVLVIRFSAFGDVAMTIPVIYSVARAYPQDRFIFVTKSPFECLFINKPSNIEVIPYGSEVRSKGIIGLHDFIKKINSTYSIDRVADLHNVLRSRQIDFYFKLQGKNVAVISKGRRSKKLLTQRTHKRMEPLESSIERYHQVFRKLGYENSLNFISLFENQKEVKLPSFIPLKKNNIWIGVAPFAQHPGKVYPLEKMHQVIDQMATLEDTEIFLFGGKNEKDQLESWASDYKNVRSMAGKTSIYDELTLISQLDVMVTMDSANMHLASLVNTPVVSIWGATHPYAGFNGYNQNLENVVQLDLPCRPCSVFGNKSCYRKDFACMMGITPEKIVQKVKQITLKDSI